MIVVGLVVVVVVVVTVVLVVVVHVVVNPRNLPLKFGQKWISNSQDIVVVKIVVVDVVVVAVSVVIVVVFVLVHVVAVDPRNIPLEFGQNRISNS